MARVLAPQAVRENQVVVAGGQQVHDCILDIDRAERFLIGAVIKIAHGAGRAVVFEGLAEPVAAIGIVLVGERDDGPVTVRVHQKRPAGPEGLVVRMGDDDGTIDVLIRQPAHAIWRHFVAS